MTFVYTVKDLAALGLLGVLLACLAIGAFFHYGTKALDWFSRKFKRGE